MSIIFIIIGICIVFYGIYKEWKVGEVFLLGIGIPIILFIIFLVFLIVANIASEFLGISVENVGKTAFQYTFAFVALVLISINSDRITAFILGKKGLVRAEYQKRLRADPAYKHLGIYQIDYVDLKMRQYDINQKMSADDLPESEIAKLLLQKEKIEQKLQDFATFFDE
ncbi:MAG: hypothetical protein LBG12_02670 [Synergistaceae bacterium]|jgi:hypothetical protein|nr:hypothetical protein [Synergistaceae bacterium]